MSTLGVARGSSVGWMSRHEGCPRQLGWLDEQARGLPEAARLPGLARTRVARGSSGAWMSTHEGCPRQLGCLDEHAWGCPTQLGWLDEHAGHSRSRCPGNADHDGLGGEGEGAASSRIATCGKKCQSIEPLESHVAEACRRARRRLVNGLAERSSVTPSLQACASVRRVRLGGRRPSPRASPFCRPPSDCKPFVLKGRDAPGRDRITIPPAE